MVCECDVPVCVLYQKKHSIISNGTWRSIKHGHENFFREGKSLRINYPGQSTTGANQGNPRNLCLLKNPIQLAILRKDAKGNTVDEMDKSSPQESLKFPRMVKPSSC
jgi:hypothetical protein